MEDESGRSIDWNQLRPGKWLDGYIPPRSEVQWIVGEGGLHIDVEERDSGTRWKYQRGDMVTKGRHYGETENVYLKDIIIIGEVSAPVIQAQAAPRLIEH